MDIQRGAENALFARDRGDGDLLRLQFGSDRTVLPVRMDARIARAAY